MAYTTNELITRAYYLSGIVARDFQTVSGSQINDGLQMLNDLLDVKTAQQRFIPYFTTYDFNTVIGQEIYYTANLISVETLTFAIGVVRYSLQRVERKEYFGTPRVNNIQTLPYSYYVERQFGGANVYLYFVPSQIFAMELVGKFSLADVVLGQDLSLTIDLFYIEYLRFALAEYICLEYNRDFQPQNAAKLLEYENMITDISPIDLSMTKVSNMQRGNGMDIWGLANLSKGWVP